jgi:signal transduction histidine kinase
MLGLVPHRRDDTDFLVYLSHELRTALNAMLGHAQLLQLAELDRDSALSIEQIVSAGWHMTGLLDEVHEVVTLEGGGGSVSLERIELEPLLHELVFLVQPLARDRSIEIEIAAFPDGAVVTADRRRLTQVMLNLLSNAIKYNSEDGRVEVRCEVVARSAKIAIVDTGPGITRERLGDLFAPFERLGAEHGTVGGSGIGLALSRRMVELMDGVLDVESVPGVGAIFTVGLPLASSHELDEDYVKAA